MKNPFKGKDVIVFDLDGTLVKSKLPLDREMAGLLAKLTTKKKVAIIGGGKISLFRWQLIEPMAKEQSKFENLFLFPTSGAAFYRHLRGWRMIYRLKLGGEEAERIKGAFKKALLLVGFKQPKKIYGAMIENRGTQVTFSAAGQLAPLSVKKKWNRSDMRPKIMKEMAKLLPGFGIRAGGLTSIDITKKGVNKGSTTEKFIKIIGVPKKSVLFIGDAIYPGGNDYAAFEAGFDCLKVSDPGDTKKIIRKLLV
ncbi:HAD-IIB family hydrolase [bacterium]|nr:MAG: HAD-IIB family hydrolase [bacterium]